MSDRDATTSARAIHALASSRRPRSQQSPAHSVASSDEVSTFNPDNDDALMSTKHHIDEDDSHFLPKIRTTAQGRRYYNPVVPANVASSAVRREFGDFDHSNSTEDEDDDSIEIGRGISNTPSRPNKSLDSDILMDIGNSHYGTPPSRLRQTPKSNLRREAQLRRASSTRLVNGNVKSAKENNVPQQEDNTRPTRSTSRTVSANNNPYQRPLAATPQRTNGTPRGAPGSTFQSFLIPDIANITDLFGASSLNNGLHDLPRTGLPNRRAVSAYNGRQPGTFIPVGGVPIPEEEKAILASLQMVRDRLNQVEQERDDAERRIEEYELHVADLQAQIDAQGSLRRSDSALGSSDGEAASSKNKWKIEKAQLEASTASMQRRLEQAERKTSTAEAATKRVTSERDSLAAQLSVAYYNNEEMKGENEILQNENRLLHDQVANLQSENRALTAENDEMRAQHDKSHERHEDETTRWQKKEATLNRKVNTNDRAILQENQTLRDELVRTREQQEKAEEKARRREEKARREAERAAELEHVKLIEEKEQLQLELEQAKEARQAEINRWKSKQAELQAHIDQREETIHQLRVAVPQEQINDDLRMENQDLKAELASLKMSRIAVEEQGTPKETLRKRLEEVTNQHVEANERWTRKETRLQEKLEQAKEVNELYRELDTVREQSRTTRSTADGKTKRRSTGQIATSVSDALHAQTARAYPNTRSRSKSQSRRHPRDLCHVSAPTMSLSEDEASMSDASTTDLSFDPAILAGAPRSGGKGKRATGFVQVQTHTEEDITFLSFTPEIEIAKLRKRVEEEHMAARQGKASVGASRATQDETTGYGRRRSSFKENSTGRSRASSRARSVLSAQIDNTEDESVIEDATSRSHKDDTMHSHISRVSRASHHSRSRSRRRSSAAFQEMTSAFIIPDITMHTRDGTINTKDLKSLSHDTKNCSVCQRILSSSPADTDSLNIPTPIPITTRESYKNDIDATLRPAQAPAKALSQVIKELQDELQHLQLEFGVLQSRQQATDPTTGARLRAALHKKIDRVHKMIQVKEKQIYSLYDVCEAHKVDLANMQHGEEEDTELPEEVERTLENVLEARGRRVEFENEEDSVNGSEWMGIGDTTGL